MLWAVLLGWAVWGHVPDGLAWAGIALLVCAGLYLVQRDRMRHEQPVGVDADALHAPHEMVLGRGDLLGGRLLHRSPVLHPLPGDELDLAALHLHQQHTVRRRGQDDVDLGVLAGVGLAVDEGIEVHAQAVRGVVAERPEALPGNLTVGTALAPFEVQHVVAEGRCVDARERGVLQV